MKRNFTGYITSKGAGSPHISTRFSFPPSVATCRHFSSSWPSRYFYLHSWCILNFSFHLRLLLIYSALWRKAVLDIIWHLEGSWASWHGLPAYPSSPNLHRAHTQLRQRQREREWREKRSLLPPENCLCRFPHQSKLSHDNRQMNEWN